MSQSNDFTQYRVLQQARLLSCYKETDELIKAYDNDLEKAEGSRGGKIIGHTRNGHPIYSKKKASEYSNWTAGDHEDASEAHNKHFHASGKESSLPLEHKKLPEDEHNELAEKLNNEKDKSSIEEMQVKYNKLVEMSKKSPLNKAGSAMLKDLSEKLKSIKIKKSMNAGDTPGKEFVEKAMTAEEGEGTTQKESVEHDPKDMQNAKASDLKKAFEILGIFNDIQKGGEGSKGGKVIGHTKSGKPIYDNVNHPSHKNFTKQDHLDAENHHIDNDNVRDANMHGSLAKKEMSKMKKDNDKEPSQKNVEKKPSKQQQKLNDLTKQIGEYFKDNDVSLTDKFSLKDFSNDLGVSVDKVHVILHNVEKESVMKDIANGDYSSFDLDDSSIFNDSYDDMMEDLFGEGDDDED